MKKKDKEKAEKKGWKRQKGEARKTTKRMAKGIGYRAHACIWLIYRGKGEGWILEKMQVEEGGELGKQAWKPLRVDFLWLFSEMRYILQTRFPPFAFLSLFSCSLGTARPHSIRTPQQHQRYFETLFLPSVLFARPSDCATFVGNLSFSWHFYLKPFCSTLFFAVNEEIPHFTIVNFSFSNSWYFIENAMYVEHITTQSKHYFYTKY